MTQQRPTKAQRKEQARRDRLELERRMARRRTTRRLWAVLVVVAIAAAVAWLATRPGGGRDGRLPGLLSSRTPWPANTATLAERLGELGLPRAGGAQHVHAHLGVFIEGQAVDVPSEVGIAGAIHSPLHTHDDTGVIHVESEVPRTFTLGELFDVWGVRLSASCVGGYCADGASTIRAFVGGEAFDGDPRTVQLVDGAVVVLAFGTEDQLPDPIPSEFDFSAIQG